MSKIKINILNKANEEVYEEYIRKYEKSSFNNSIKFCYFLKHLFKGLKTAPLYFIAEKDNTIVGVLPAFVYIGKYGQVLNSLPWFGSNPGILADNKEVKEKLLRMFFKIGKQLDCLSATIITKPFEQISVYEKAKKQLNLLEDFRIGTITNIPEYKSENQCFNKILSIIHGKTRNQIKKSLKHCSIAEDYSDFAFQFLSKTHKQNMEVMEAPVKETEFKILQENFKKREDYKLYIAKNNQGESIAALLLKFFNKTVDYMTPVIRKEFRNLNPLHALIIKAMVDASKNQYKYWNWGGTMPQGMDGVLHFKKRFGGETCKYNYFTKLHRNIPEGVTKEELLKEYPYFYVLPFSHLVKED